MGQCDVCGSGAEAGRHGEMRQFRCDRCGPFMITGSAVAVLKGRTHKSSGAVNELVVAKVSHFIRLHSSEDQWLEIHSDMIDEMVAQKLPSPSQQQENLLRWMAEQAGEDHFKALEFSETDVCSIMGAASPDAASDLIEDAGNNGLIEFVPDDNYQLTRLAWDRLEATARPAARRYSGDDFVDAARVAQLRAIESDQFDLSRLLRMCEELNDAWRSGRTISVAMLARAIVDHVPPIFGRDNFSQVASNSSRSMRGSLQHIDTSLRHIADGALHTHTSERGRASLRRHRSTLGKASMSC